jgi:predicted SAM-dependent methyltransferase
MISHKDRIHDLEGRDILRTICIGKGIDVGCADRPINDEVDTLDIEAEYLPTYIGNILDMPIEDNTYDFLIASHVLEHVDNTIDALKEFKRIVKIGGKVGIMVPHGEYVDYVDLGDSSMTHRVLFTEKTLGKYLLHVGFKIIKVIKLERPLASGKVPAIVAIAEND